MFKFKSRIISIHTESFNYTLVLDSVVIKILNKKRFKELKKEFKEWGFIEIDNYENQRDKFKIVCNAPAHLYKDMLFIKKIDAISLSRFLNQKEKFLNLLGISVKKLENLNKERGFYHSDFHIDNILAKNKHIYFIDFDYKYKDEYLEYAFYIDLVNLVFYFKRNYFEYYKKYKSDLEMIFSQYEIPSIVKNLFPYKEEEDIFELFR